jgi:serine/threonine-protein kinase
MEADGLPEKIGRYEVIQHLASGGMADLYLCRQTGPMGFKKLAAVKQIRGDFTDDDEFHTMFLDEARIAALLTHPNIAQIYELGTEGGQPYLAMEFVNGRNLSAIFKKLGATGATMPPQIAAAVLAGVLRGLAYAHQRKDLDGAPLNLVHRDVTPQNVLISNDGQIKLVDFGIAKASNQVARTRHGVLKGKYSYMSPEQVRGHPLDGRSDLFAVGILLYEALTAHRPFKRGSTIETLKAIVSELPPDPRRYNAAVPPELLGIIARALFKKRAKRFADASQMLGALERWLHAADQPVTAASVATWVGELFAGDEQGRERTIVLKDLGEILLPQAGSLSSQVASAVPDSSSGIPEKTVMTMLSQIAPYAADEFSGSISVELDEDAEGDSDSLVADSSATVPHLVSFEATLDELPVDDRTQISDSPHPASLEWVPNDEPSARSLPEPSAAGYRVNIDDFPARPGPAQEPSGLLHQLGVEIATNRLALLKLIALGVGIGIALLVGMIVLVG